MRLFGRTTCPLTNLIVFTSSARISLAFLHKTIFSGAINGLGNVYYGLFYWRIE
jgi:hypothetical protein